MTRVARFAVLVPLVLLAGCGSRVDLATTPSYPVPPHVSAAPTLLPDGTVPWVEEPGGNNEFSTPATPRLADPNAGPCRADQLRGELPSWSAPKGVVESGARPQREPAKLIGFVKVTNTGKVACRLRGEVDTRMRDQGGELRIGYSHGVNDESRTRVTVVPPGGDAVLRLDWTGPFCLHPNGSVELDIRLPEEGGSLRAPVRSADRPPCSQDENHPEYSSYLSASAFDEPPTDAATDSPLAALSATQEPVVSARSGELETCYVRLENKTDKAVSLDPCPGYLQQLASEGGNGVRPVNDSGVFRMNCRPIKEIPAHGSVRFALGLRVPQGLAAGRPLLVNWRLLAPGLSLGSPLAGFFTVTVAA
ncbi:hypothetical protein F0L68_03210 [Solihabitans fulvus]|uniref:DUF4232 domain-containing protein n=1 Tax=Solihabitans fulvus TaxID=1892852 RepID=A0A5B2XT85_9PSEU|nr:hypothetical protein [Solihabitans fulvus]KAA2266140.1 hypothetical protein F0L68_03210 [Solihabitans fulvus]